MNSQITDTITVKITVKITVTVMVKITVKIMVKITNKIQFKIMVKIRVKIKEAISLKKKHGLNTCIARKGVGGGGGVNPCPNIFGALFYEPLDLGKMPKRGGGGEGLAKRFGEL